MAEIHPNVTLASLPHGALEFLRAQRYDPILEKHEGPESWSSVFKYGDPEFIDAGGRAVLFPIDRQQLPGLRILRCYDDSRAGILTLFLRDPFFCDNEEDSFERMFSGFLAVCRRIPDVDAFFCIVYHSWFAAEDLIAELPAEIVA